MATWWQATRAAAGNTLSWAYAFEWPIFAAIAVVAWWQLIHEDRAEVAARRAARRAEIDPAGEASDAEAGSGPEARPSRRAEGTLSPLDVLRAEASIAAYNDYVSGLTVGRRRQRRARRDGAGAGT